MKEGIYKLFNKIFSEEVKSKFEKAILWLSIAGFMIHLGLIYLNSFNVISFGLEYKLLANPISALYTPFSFILLYEIYLLVLCLPRSFTTSLSKQFEIISLILIRRIFADIPKIEMEVDWFKTQANLNLIYDLIGVLFLFFLIYLFNQSAKSRIINVSKTKIDSFVIAKKIISLILLFCLILMCIYSLFSWITDWFNNSLPENVNSIFYNDFFELLILADVFILLISFKYTEKYSQIIRNTGFIISTVLIRLSFATTGFTNVILIISSVIFGLLILKVYNLYETSA
ncbi:MAG: hypothetical protein ABF268_04920 [Polaribacter sp.]